MNTTKFKKELKLYNVNEWLDHHGVSFVGRTYIKRAMGRDLDALCDSDATIWDYPAYIQFFHRYKKYLKIEYTEYTINLKNDVPEWVPLYVQVFWMDLYSCNIAYKCFWTEIEKYIADDALIYEKYK